VDSRRVFHGEQLVKKLDKPKLWVVHDDAAAALKRLGAQDNPS
jgi:hypothetical protein